MYAFGQHPAYAARMDPYMPPHYGDPYGQTMIPVAYHPYMSSPAPVYVSGPPL